CLLPGPIKHVSGRNQMSAYHTIVVGTDGSDSSLAAVTRAARVAADSDAILIIACAYYPAKKDEITEAQDALGDEAYQVVGSAPAENTLRTAREHATAAGATTIETISRVGAPVESLATVVNERSADLLVVGNRGLNTLTGRILGSVPSEAA